MSDPKPDDKIMVQVRLPRELVREIDHFSIDEDLYRAHAFEQLLRAGLKAKREHCGSTSRD